VVKQREFSQPKDDLLDETCLPSVNQTTSATFDRSITSQRTARATVKRTENLFSSNSRRIKQGTSPVDSPSTEHVKLSTAVP
jgi:hypothetical protein